MQALNEYLGEEPSEALQQAYIAILAASERVIGSRRLGQPLQNEAEVMLAALEPLQAEHEFLDWDDSLDSE